MGEESNYTPYAVPGEGERFGLLTCLRCGAAVMLMPRENNAGLHDAWHDFLTANLELPNLSSPPIGSRERRSG